MAIKAKDQVTVLDITDAYSVILTSEAYTFVGNTSGAPSGLSCSTQVVAYQGSTQCTKVTVTVTPPTGIKADIAGNNGVSPTITFTTTATVTSSCEATIAVKIDDTTINKKFSFSVAKQGSTGSAGKGIKSITEHYAVSTSNATAPTSWQSTPPAMTETNKYLWNYETIAYTNGPSSDTKKRVIGVYGNKGATGAKGDTGETGPRGPQGPQGDTGETGTSVTKTTRYYKLQDSTAPAPSVPTTNPPSGWTTTEPGYQSGKLLYFVDITVFSNGSVSYSAVSLSSSYKAASDVKDQVDEIKLNYRFDNDGQYIGREGSNTVVHTTNDKMAIEIDKVPVTEVTTSGLAARSADVSLLRIGQFAIVAPNDAILEIHWHN